MRRNSEGLFWADEGWSFFTAKFQQNQPNHSPFPNLTLTTPASPHNQAQSSPPPHNIHPSTIAIDNIVLIVFLCDLSPQLTTHNTKSHSPQPQHEAIRRHLHWSISNITSSYCCDVIWQYDQYSMVNRTIGWWKS